MDRFQAHLITSSLVIYCSPKPPAPVQNFLPPPVNANTLASNSHRFKGPTYPHIILWGERASKWALTTQALFMECFWWWAILFGLLNLISVERWSNLVSEHIFVHVFHHRPPRKYEFFWLLCEFSMERFQAHVITRSSANHSTPQPPSQLCNCLPPLSTEAGIQFRKIHGCHVAMHLISCHRRSILWMYHG